LHILWINLVTDGLPALALVTDPTDEDVMKRPPRRPDEPMLGRNEWLGILGIGLMQATVTLGVFLWALEARGLEEARNLAFTTLVIGELFRAFGARSTRKTFWEIGLFTNMRLLVIVMATASLQLLIHHVPALQKLMQIGPLSLADCTVIFLVGLTPLFVMELWKLALRNNLLPVRLRRADDKETLS
jgi:Ca2+-transporting ATPase